MAKKRKRIDYDSPLMSIYSPEYQYLMRQNAPENANVAGLGDWLSNLFNRNKQQPDYHRDTVSMGLGTENSLQGVGNGGTDWNNQNFSLTNQQQFNYNPNQELTTSQQYQNTLKDPKNLAPKQTGEQTEKPSVSSNVNWGGIIGAAGTSAANAIQEGGSAADVAAGIMGIPVLAKMWKANTKWGDAKIKEAQEKIANPSVKYIQDANDIQGAGQGIKLNNQKDLNLIDTSGMLNTNNWKKFSSGRGSGTWWKNMATAQLQGAAAGSVGGPWGALGGATAGLLGSIGGLFGSKKRAKRAMEQYNDNMTTLRNYATMENQRRITERNLSNQNMLSNAMTSQKLQDMANFRAFGGNLYPDGGSIDPYYPESQDPTAVNWLSDWYRQRPEQLRNTFYGSTYDMPNPNMSGEYEELSDIPLDRTINPSSKFFDDSLYKSLIDRAATTSPVYRMDMPSTTLGEYSPSGQNIVTEDGFVNYPNAAHTISYNMRDVPAFANPDEDYYDKETLPLRIHENNHAITHGFDSIAKEINNRIVRKDGVERDSYKDNPYEVHSYMMEFRNKTGLNPTDIITKDVLNKYRKELKETNLDRYTDDSLIDLFNNVVDNNDMKRYSNVAAFGGGLDLSPNMMNLWNDKQNIDKQKLMNQQMNFGLGNSFNTKLNMFDLGGYPDLVNYADSYKNSIDEAERRDREFENVYRKDWGRRTPVYANYTEDDFIRESNNPDNPDLLGLSLSAYNKYKYRRFLDYPNENVGTAYLHYPRNTNEIYDATPDSELPIYKDKDGYWYLKQGIPHPSNGYDNIPKDDDSKKGFIRNKKGDLRLNSKDIKLYKEKLKRTAWDNDFYNFVATQRENDENEENKKKGNNTANESKNTDNTTANNNSSTIPNLDDIVYKYMKDNNIIGNNTNTDNTTANRKPSSNLTEKQKEYYNKKKQSYSDFNKDMGFVTKDDVKRFQEAYNKTHNDKLKVDGLTGDKTIKAYQRWVNELNKDNKDKEDLKIDGFYGKKSKATSNSDVINRMLNNGKQNNRFDNITIDTDASGYAEDYSTPQIEEPNIYEQEKYEDLYGNDYNNIDQNIKYYYNNYPYAQGGRLNRFDYGGAMNGLDLPTGMQYYENGGSHEENPNGGIQIGQDQQGNPNLVEEGEFRYGDYIFSDRIPVDYSILSDFNVEKGKSNRNTKNNPTYAELAKKTADKYKDLNDKISKDSLNKQLDRLQQSQEAQKFKEQQDQQYADYTNALKNPTQGNPMYGNMKYNGMGNANQGLNAGVDDGMGNAMDNSDLSNVNRSGNPMMAAYGGNLFALGSAVNNPKKILPWEEPMNLEYRVTIPQSNSLAGININTNPYYGNVRDHQQLLINNGYDIVPDGVYGPATENAMTDFRHKIYGQTQAGTQTVNNSNSNSTYSSDRKYVSVDAPLNPNSQKPETGEVTNSTKTNSSANDVVPVENLGEVDRQQGNLAGSSPFDWNRYNEAGRYGQLAKGLVPNLMNWSGQTNWNYDPNWRPSNELEALGHSSYASRTSDHLGDYIAPNLMDLERLNNAAMAQTAAQQRGIQNISNGNRGFVGAQNAATDYNGQMGIGNNYATTEQYNADQKQRAAEFNRATNQFNAQANNDMYRDNLNAWMQGRQMDIQAMEAANRERQFERQYKDRVDRDAALNKQKDLAAMFDNQMNFLADEAEYNRRLNDMNSRRNSRFWYDKKEGWQERNDNGFTSKLRDAIDGAILNSDDFNQISKIQNNDKYTDDEKIAMIQNIADSARARNKQENDAVAAEKKKEIQNYLSEAQSYFNLLNSLQDYQPWNNAKSRYSDPNYFTYTDDLTKEIAKHRMDELQNMWFNYTTRYNPNAVEEVHTPQTTKTKGTKAYGGKLKRKREYDYMSI